MPTTMPGVSIVESQRVLQVANRILKNFPEVEHVLGKAGRSDSATDPAPLSMLETIIVLKPQSEWRKRETWYSSWAPNRSEEHTSELQSHSDLVCRLLLEKKKKKERGQSV